MTADEAVPSLYHCKQVIHVSSAVLSVKDVELTYEKDQTRYRR